MYDGVASAHSLPPFIEGHFNFDIRRLGWQHSLIAVTGWLVRIAFVEAGHALGVKKRKNGRGGMHEGQSLLL